MKVVYVTHNGAGTALVRSQVLPYLEGLAKEGVEVALITFEREAATARPLAAGWHPVRSSRGGSLIAKLRDIAAGTLLASRLVRGASLLHARSYLPAAIAWTVSRWSRRPYLFDMRGFLPEEYVEGGHWREGELRHRVLRWAERWLLRDSAAIVVLTRRAAQRLRDEPRYSAAVRRTPVFVIPCAVDLDRFVPGADRDGPPVLVYAGSLGMWYELDAMLRVFGSARALRPDLRFLILNQGQHEVARAAALRHGLDAGVDVRGAPFDDMPRHLAASHVGISLLRRSSSKLGSSPIKVAEYLACGLPVVLNADQGDSDELVSRYSAGHVMRDYGPDEISRAAEAVVRLAGDTEARRNARVLAEREYSVPAAVLGYLSAYAAATGTLRGPRGR